MNIPRQTLACLLATAFTTLAAHAQTPLTRADVVADYNEAVRTGELMAPGDSGMKLNELYPDRYPKAATPVGLTRAQVVAELQAAVRSGDVMAAGDVGMKLNELHPERYAAPAVVAGKTREQVRAETLEAIRTGDVLVDGDSGLKLNELFPQRYARAIADGPLDRSAVAAAPSTREARRIQ